MGDRISNDKSIGKGVQISNKHYDTDKSLLLGGTQKRKRKRVDYTRLNHSGFDIFCSHKRSNEENHSFRSRTEKVISVSMSTPKKDDDKTDSNCKQIPATYSMPQEFKLLKNMFNLRDNVTKPQNKVTNAHEKRYTKKMKTVTNCISLEQKESSFVSENIFQKIPINEFVYKDIKLQTLKDDSDWDPKEYNNSTTRKRKKGYKTKKHKAHNRKTGYSTKKHKEHNRKTGYSTKNIKHITEKQDILQRNIKHIKNITEK